MKNSVEEMRSINRSGELFLYFQGTQRRNLESTVSQIEKEKMLLQHRINEYQRKAEQENEKRRNVENEGRLLLFL